ncbi:MAG: Flp pilus assembly complex ATPase component TadA [Actinomycetota bacterium]|nr:Flp pilus assembly complex ATPase component TadA [Actinomycetota bacterium]
MSARRVLGGRSGGRPPRQTQPDFELPTPHGPVVGNGAAPSGPSQEDTALLGELLVEKGLVTASQLSQALLQQDASGKRIGELLVELGAVNERDMVEVLAMQLVIPLVDFRTAEPEPEAVALIAEAVARATGTIPVRVEGNTLEVATSDPLDQARIDAIRNEVGLALRFVLASPSDILQAIDGAYRVLAGMDRHVEAFEAGAALRRGAAVPLSGAGEGPIAEAVDSIIVQALRDRASDVHIEPQDSRVRVRYRIDGVLHDVLALPDSMAAALLSRVKVMADMNIVERRRPQDGQFTKEVDGRSIDVRVSTYPMIWGEKAVLRLLDRNRLLFHLEDLGMSPEGYERYNRLVRSPVGMVVCAGPTGSGKTTTLYATLTDINDIERNIVTLEDPVEYVFPSINQTQINEQAGITFADSLRGILRQDPDVILVGEIRDAETARIAVQSALTGHLVLSSLHGTDTASALHRFLDMGVEPFLIASSVIGIVSQRLVRRICRHCRVPYAPSVDEMALYEQCGGPPKRVFGHGEGCNLCSRTGYSGRTGIYEVMSVTDAVKEVLVAKGSPAAIRKAAMAEGMRSLQQEAVRLVTEDVTTLAEVSRSMYTL